MCKKVKKFFKRPNTVSKCLRKLSKRFKCSDEIKRLEFSEHIQGVRDLLKPKTCSSTEFGEDVPTTESEISCWERTISDLLTSGVIRRLEQLTPDSQNTWTPNSSERDTERFELGVPTTTRTPRSSIKQDAAPTTSRASRSSSLQDVTTTLSNSRSKRRLEPLPQDSKATRESSSKEDDLEVLKRIENAENKTRML